MARKLLRHTEPPIRAAPAKTAVCAEAEDDTYAFSFHSTFKTRMSLTNKLNFLNGVVHLERPGLAIQHFDGPTKFADLELSDSAKLLMDCENAGGSSELSEALSFEIMRVCFGAELVKTEMDIEYEWGDYSKKTDYSMSLYHQRLGVSVTRAMAFRRDFTRADAKYLLQKKLYGVIMSTRDVVEMDEWCKQILHIFTEDVASAHMLADEYHKLDDELKSNTVILITVTGGSAQWVYTNRVEE